MQNCARLQFFERLQALVSSEEGGVVLYCFNGSPAVKDAVEALGVPHTEVDLILVADRPVSFSYRLRDADSIAVYPFGSQVRAAPEQHLCPAISRPIAFILDVHLGKLARRLRMLGFDCRYRNDYSDPQIIEQALREKLIILTRDRGILKHSCVEQGYLVGSQAVEEQVQEVLQRYALAGQIQALQRCPQCNGLLSAIDKDRIQHRLQPKTARYYRIFHICRDCGQLYWQGSHFEKIEKWLQQLGVNKDEL